MLEVPSVHLNLVEISPPPPLVYLFKLSEGYKTAWYWNRAKLIHWGIRSKQFNWELLKKAVHPKTIFWLFLSLNVFDTLFILEQILSSKQLSRINGLLNQYPPSNRIHQTNYRVEHRLFTKQEVDQQQPIQILPVNYLDTIQCPMVNVCAHDCRIKTHLSYMYVVVNPTKNTCMELKTYTRVW